jgi:PIN domain nuclease of toxin-antitoxin system
MKALLDSGVWFRRFHGLPLSPAVRRELARVTDWHLSAYSVLEILYKWRRGKLPVADPARWLEAALAEFTVHPVGVAVARRAAVWAWAHGDPGDRVIAATAAESGLTLIHTDTVLRDLPGFQQRYCPGA